MDPRSEFKATRAALIEKQRKEFHVMLVDLFMAAMDQDLDIAIPYAIRQHDGIHIKSDMFSAMLNMFASEPKADMEFRRAIRMKHAQNAFKFLMRFRLEAANAYATSYALLMAEAAVDASIKKHIEGDLP